MGNSALERLEQELRGWCRAYNEVQEYDADHEALLRQLSERIGAESLGHIGAAFLNGHLQTEQSPGRGYFVRESDRPGTRGGQFTIIHQGGGKVAPCWELFVQLADYGRLRPIAERHGQIVRLEDDLMDLTVRSGDELVLYLEQKMKSSTAERLLEKMREHGAQGVDLSAFDKGNDPLRKAKYLIRNDARPTYFGLSAVGYEKLFRVQYEDGDRFSLEDDNRAFAAVLAEVTAGGAPTAGRSFIDDLATEIQQMCPEVWISVGSGQTAYNFYAPAEGKDALLLGVYESGEVWSNLKGLGPDVAGALSAALDAQGISLDTEKEWSFWKSDGAKLSLSSADPIAIVRAIRQVL